MLTIDDLLSSRVRTNIDLVVDGRSIKTVSTSILYTIRIHRMRFKNKELVYCSYRVANLINLYFRIQRCHFLLNEERL